MEQMQTPFFIDDTPADGRLGHQPSVSVMSLGLPSACGAGDLT